jgi:hypothetical protein
MAMRLNIAILACFIAGGALAQGLSLDEDDSEDDNPSAIQCVVEGFPGTKPITCEASPGPADAPCFCPDAGPSPGRRVRLEQ